MDFIIIIISFENNNLKDTKTMKNVGKHKNFQRYFYFIEKFLDNESVWEIK